MPLFTTEPRMRTHSMRAHNGDDARTLVDLIRELRDEFVTLLKHQTTLVQVEIEDKVRTAVRNSVYVLIGGVAAAIAAVFLLVAVTAGLYALLVTGGVSHYIAGWLSPLIIGAILAGVGGAMIAKGLAKLSNMNPTPRKTVQSMKEHQEWISEKVR